jgi:hypothetical protein
VGASDCEHIGHGLLAQPTNTLSSVAYVLAGALLLWRAFAARASARTACTVYAVTVIGVGVGSGAFHGPMPAWGRFAHDLSIVAVLAFVIGYDVALARGAAVERGVALFGVLTGVCVVVLAGWPDAANGLDALLVALAIAAELAVAQSPAGRVNISARIWIVGAAALTIAAVLDALGRTDGPLCHADSPVQLHAAWHIATAFVLWLYGVAVLRVREQARPKIRA